MRVSVRSEIIKTVNIEDLSVEALDDLIEGLMLMKRVQAMHRDTHELLRGLRVAKHTLEN